MFAKWVKTSRDFIKQVLQEGRRVIWPTQRDVLLTSIIVFVIASIFSVFLFVVDQSVVTLLHTVFGVSSRG